MDRDLGEFDEADVGELRRRLAEVESVNETLEARLALYQNALETIRATTGGVLDC